jgi:hydrogenase nickel incorporation protein HypA/HybF
MYRRFSIIGLNRRMRALYIGKLSLLYSTMHEFSLCEGIVSGVRQELEKIEQKPARLLKTRIVVGGLHQIVEDTLVFAYEVLTRDTPMKGSVLEILKKAVTCKCRDCAWSGEIIQPLFRCGVCTSGNVEIISGNELYIESLEVDVNEQ